MLLVTDGRGAAAPILPRAAFLSPFAVRAVSSVQKGDLLLFPC